MLGIGLGYPADWPRSPRPSTLEVMLEEGLSPGGQPPSLSTFFIDDTRQERTGTGHRHSRVAPTARKDHRDDLSRTSGRSPGGNTSDSA